MIILALDYGERYVGVAVTDVDGKIALRHSVIDRQKEELGVAVPKIIAQEQVQKVIVGVPLGLDGNETAQTHESFAFIDELRDRLGVAVDVDGVDERFTSKEAARMIREDGSKPEEIHAEAARLMLETYLKLSL